MDDITKYDYLTEGKIDDIIYEDPIMVFVDNMIDEDTEAEDSIIKGDFECDPALIDIVDVEHFGQMLMTGSDRY